jgi:16S rRNA (cytidine1402-2'-O)-methyltransferase
VAAAVANEGLVVTCAPGVSAVTAALSVSGLATDRFCFEGFVPRKLGERRVRFDQWETEQRTVVFFESPRRLAGTLNEMIPQLGSRTLVVARELTKLHEEVLRGTVASIALAVDRRELRGECVAVLAGAGAPPELDDAALSSALQGAFGRGLSARDAANEIADQFGLSHRRAYAAALEIRRVSVDLLTTLE